jgi:hypothetical protein
MHPQAGANEASTDFHRHYIGCQETLDVQMVDGKKRISNRACLQLCLHNARRYYSSGVWTISMTDLTPPPTES